MSYSYPGMMLAMLFVVHCDKVRKVWDISQINWAKALRALNAECVPCSSGYEPQNKDGLIEDQLTSKGYKRIFSESRLRQWCEENVLPVNDKPCNEAVIFLKFHNFVYGGELRLLKCILYQEEIWSDQLYTVHLQALLPLLCRAGMATRNHPGRILKRVT